MTQIGWPFGMTDSERPEVAKFTIPMSKENLIDHLARIMRNSAYPEFKDAPPPEWSLRAARVIHAFYEDVFRDNQGRRHD